MRASCERSLYEPLTPNLNRGSANWLFSSNVGITGWYNIVRILRRAGRAWHHGKSARLPGTVSRIRPVSSQTL